jgi:hypothetical protein
VLREFYLTSVLGVSVSGVRCASYMVMSMIHIVVVVVIDLIVVVCQWKGEDTKGTTASVHRKEAV